ncbi:hypothetical protein ACKFKF_13940 [Phormidesmis sp. 146-12]
MTFPYLVTAGQTSPFTAEQLQQLRQTFIDQFLFAQPTLTDNPVAEQLSQITRILSHSAGNETTVYDNGSARSTASSAANGLSQQVERALTQVLGRAPGRGSDGFISALNSAFPTAKNGQVMMTPARSLVSLYNPNELNGMTGQLSVAQANLYRQGSIIGQDALKVLEGLTSFDPTADVDAVEALRSLIQSQIRTLVDEFGRLDEPRKQRVETYLNTLSVKSPVGSESGGNRLIGGSLLKFGEKARLINRNGQVEAVLPVTLGDETQIAGFELLINYVDTLRRIWVEYDITTSIETQVTGRYSERLSRASIMLPVISDSNASLMSAMDSVGFTESERRSDAALFDTLESPGSVTISSGNNGTNLTITANFALPNITVNDFDEWVDRFTTLEAPSLLSTSGQFGLDFVTDQADTLFWTIASVLYAITPDVNNLSNGGVFNKRNQTKLLGRVLSFERVQQTLSELVFQLDTLADLGVGSVSSASPITPTRPIG